MRRPLLATIAVAALTLVGCGGDDDTSGDSTAAPTSPAATLPAASGPTVPAATAAATSPTSGPAATNPPAATGTATSTGATAPPASAAPAPDDVPAAIVSLSPTATEMLFAIGAGDQVIAVDEQSNFPPEAAAVATDLSGYQPNIEAIAGYEPDLVVVSDDTVTDQLEALGIAVWVGPAAQTFEDAYAQIEQLGAVTGHIAEAAQLVATMRADLAEIAAEAPAMEPPLRIFHELDNTLYSADSTTFVGQVYSLFGLENIADRAEGNSGGYPQLSAEAVISADPQIVFLADAAYGETPETVAARPGWGSVSAVTAGAIVPVDADVASRWGPRAVEYARFVADHIAELAPAGG